MRVVLDTVILVRGLMSPSSWWGRLVFDYADRYVLIVSAPILAEYLDVLGRPNLVEKYRSVGDRSPSVIMERLARAENINLSDVPSIVRDPDDDIFFATAKAGSARYIVTEDKDQLAVGVYESIRVCTAEQFLEIIAPEDAGKRSQ